MKKIKITKRGNQPYASANDLTIPEWYTEQVKAKKGSFLKHSLHEKGFLKPITINMFDGRQGIILDGVQTLKVCQELKVVEIPVFIAYIEPERECECHVLLNESETVLTDEQKRQLMRERYEDFFGENNYVLNDDVTSYDIVDENESEGAIDTSDLMNVAQLKSDRGGRKSPKPLRRCVFNLPPEYRDYPEIAMEVHGFKSKSELFIQLLKWCVEADANEAA